MTIKFTGRHFPSDIILQAVRYYVSYKLSYRKIEEIRTERGIDIDHSTINLWVIKYAPRLEHRARRRKMPVAVSWRMDETYEPATVSPERPMAENKETQPTRVLCMNRLLYR